MYRILQQQRHQRVAIAWKLSINHLYEMSVIRPSPINPSNSSLSDTVPIATYDIMRRVAPDTRLSSNVIYASLLLPDWILLLQILIATVLQFASTIVKRRFLYSIYKFTNNWLNFYWRKIDFNSVEVSVSEMLYLINWLDKLSIFIKLFFTLFSEHFKFLFKLKLSYL